MSQNIQIREMGISKIHIAQNHKKTQTTSEKLIIKKRKQLQRRILDIKDSTPTFIFYCFSGQARMTSKSTQKVLGNWKHWPLYYKIWPCYFKAIKILEIYVKSTSVTRNLMGMSIFVVFYIFADDKATNILKQAWISPLDIGQCPAKYWVISN